jgi:hypothetical protein
VMTSAMHYLLGDKAARELRESNAHEATIRL